MRAFSFVLRACAVVAVAVALLTDAHVRAAIGSSSGIDPANLDRTCKPCDDFYQFAVGGWIAKNPIPAAYPGYGAFQKLDDNNQDVLHGIVEAAAKTDASPGSNQQKVGDYYGSCMDLDGIEKAGTTPVAPLLALASGATAANLGDTLAALHEAEVNAFFRFGQQPDDKNSSTSIARLAQGGLGLPDRDYYTRTDAKSKAVLAAYQAHVAAMLQLLGDPAPTATIEAANVLALESALANAQLTIVQRRSPEATYHRMTFAQASALAPALQLDAFVKATGIDGSAAVNVAEPSYVKALSQQIETLPPGTLHAYLRWQVVNAYATALPEAFDTAHWEFYDKTLEGSQEQLPRWKRCVAATDDALGEALGQLYVQQAFPPQAKAEALEMVRNVKAELRDDFSTLSWMSPRTRALAIKKLDAFLLKIGYPDAWRDYAKLVVTKGPYASNRLAANRFDANFQYAKIGKPVDRLEWEMTPPTVNAYYDEHINEIVFPAGILQPPFFNPDADPAVNYGGIGAVVGHESTHGFDDQGRKYDAAGNMSNWWTPQDATAFNSRAQCIVNQWNALQPLPGVHEVGKQIEGEEIADLGGVTIAFKAFEKWQSQHPRRTIDGFTPEQRFFLGWAQVWASAYRPDYIRLLAQIDVHGYDKFRVNQTLRNMPQFATAWFCKPGDKMYLPKAQQCQIW